MPANKKVVPNQATANTLKGKIPASYLGFITETGEVLIFPPGSERGQWIAAHPGKPGFPVTPGP